MRHKAFYLLLICMLSGTIARAQFSIPKAVLEIFCGADYLYVPDGYVKGAEVLAAHPDAITIYVHNNDSMTIAEEADLTNFYIPALPQALINRSGTLYSRAAWNSSLNSILAAAAPVSVAFDSVFFDATSRRLDVDIRATFTAALSGDMRFNCVVVEDSVTGTGAGYDQKNIDNNTPGHYYYGAGNPIPGLPHPYVARKYLGGTWGTAGVIPGTVAFGNQYHYHYTYILPAYINPYKVSLVGMVGTYDVNGVPDRKILNAEVWPHIATGPISNIEEYEAAAEFSIYPNPATGLFVLNAQQDGELEITNTMGQLMFVQPVKQGPNRLQPFLAAGNYFARLKTSRTVFVRPLVITN